ncbi:helix-turn-helix transcriptional regulator [Neobacillus sp. WH10]|uniref:helix-turn-helix domain-containing protein n=1 Tax=Neobacillus sp. WH10 TaxID=3047873 RepID=UPI0024C18B7A|nr:helix-turn-helix transcriptional regulator [Neobacillus sp. WH10]WHY76775.1 helix-turn-helix transcriptional regulator [Neobacillus sp. WH10]
MDGSKLKGLRKDKGYSLTKLSKLTGISKSYLSLIERGIQRNPSLDILEKLAKTFAVEVDDFVKNNKAEEKHSVKSILKVEIELSEDQLNPQKLKQIKELINAINTE